MLTRPIDSMIRRLGDTRHTSDKPFKRLQKQLTSIGITHNLLREAFPTQQITIETLRRIHTGAIRWLFYVPESSICHVWQIHCFNNSLESVARFAASDTAELTDNAGYTLLHYIAVCMSITPDLIALFPQLVDVQFEHSSNLLHSVIRQRDMVATAFLARNYPQLITGNSQGKNILHYAAQSGSIKIFDHLYSIARTLAYAKTIIGTTLIHFAANSGSVGMLEHVVGLVGWPTSDADKIKLLHYAAWSGSVEMIDYVKDLYPSLLLKTDSSGNNLLFYAIKSCAFEAFNHVLSLSSTLINGKNNNHQTALDFAAQLGSVEVILAMLKMEKTFNTDLLLNYLAKSGSANKFGTICAAAPVLMGRLWRKGLQAEINATAAQHHMSPLPSDIICGLMAKATCHVLSKEPMTRTDSHSGSMLSVHAHVEDSVVIGAFDQDWLGYLMSESTVDTEGLSQWLSRIDEKTILSRYRPVLDLITYYKSTQDSDVHPTKESLMAVLKQVEGLVKRSPLGRLFASPRSVFLTELYKAVKSLPGGRLTDAEVGNLNGLINKQDHPNIRPDNRITGAYERVVAIKVASVLSLGLSERLAPQPSARAGVKF